MGMSIESVDLRFKHSRPRSVYGTIYMNSSQSFNVHTLYYRPSSDEAERMSEPSGGPLTDLIESRQTPILITRMKRAASQVPFRWSLRTNGAASQSDDFSLSKSNLKNDQFLTSERDLFVQDTYLKHEQADFNWRCYKGSET